MLPACTPSAIVSECAHSSSAYVRSSLTLGSHSNQAERWYVWGAVALGNMYTCPCSDGVGAPLYSS